MKIKKRRMKIAARFGAVPRNQPLIDGMFMVDRVKGRVLADELSGNRDQETSGGVEVECKNDAGVVDKGNN